LAVLRFENPCQKQGKIKRIGKYRGTYYVMEKLKTKNINFKSIQFKVI